MKYVIAIWAAPLVVFWGWFFLSLNDLNFGWPVLSRQVHDIVFSIYGEILGVEPTAIPMMVAQACVLDTAILLGIWAFRRRRELTALARRRIERYRLERYVFDKSGPVADAETIT